jgi:hypothetical protein
MSQVNRTVVNALIFIGVGSVLFLSYRNKKFFLRLFYSEQKKVAFARLDNIERAEVVLKENLKFVEEMYSNYNKDIKGYTDTPELKKKLSLISSDLDFVLSTLDGIAGDQEVKDARKAIVENFKICSQRVDYIMADVTSKEKS